MANPNRSRTRRRQEERERRNSPTYVHVEGAIENKACHVSIEVCLPGPPLPGRHARALIDTGATISCVHPAVQQALGLPIVDYVVMHHADGNTRVPVVAASLIITDGRGNAVRAGLCRLAVANSTEQVIFGMDLLGGGVLTVDLVHQTWEWRLNKVDPRASGVPAPALR